MALDVVQLLWYTEETEKRIGIRCDHKACVVEKLLSTQLSWISSMLLIVSPVSVFPVNWCQDLSRKQENEFVSKVDFLLRSYYAAKKTSNNTESNTTYQTVSSIQTFTVVEPTASSVHSGTWRHECQ